MRAETYAASSTIRWSSRSSPMRRAARRIGELREDQRIVDEAAYVSARIDVGEHGAHRPVGGDLQRDFFFALELRVQQRNRGHGLAEDFCRAGAGFVAS